MTKKNTATQKMGKISLIMVITSIFISTLFSSYDYMCESKRLRQDFHEIITPVPDRLSSNLGRALWVLNKSQVNKILDTEMKNEGIYAVVVKDTEKKVYCAKERDNDWNTTESEGEISGDFEVKTINIIYEEDNVGTVEIYFTTKFIKESLKELIRNMVVKVLAISFCLVAVLLFIMNYFFVRPVSKVITGLHTVVDEISLVYDRISSASQNLAEGVLRQAAAVEETSSSLEEIISMTRENTRSANHANDMMAETSGLAGEAALSMTELTGSIGEISETSEETRKVIKTIDEFAFQTNLLALNAAVEAARAGEAGAGFAVVADEVRNLAMRSSQAARNTAMLIETSVEKINHGTDVVRKAGNVFAKVAERSENVGELFGKVVTFSQEQSLGISHVSDAMAEIDQVTQENAASAEETSATIEEIRTQIEAVKSFVSELVRLIGGKLH